MSNKAVGWAIEQEGISPTAKLVLIMMADAAGDTGLSYSSNKTIARLSGLQKEDTVAEALARLCKINLLADTGRKVGATGRIKVFQFPVSACKVKPSDEDMMCFGNPPNSGSLNPEEGAVEIPSESPANPPRIPRLAGRALKKELGTEKSAEAPSSSEKTKTAPSGSGEHQRFIKAWCDGWEAKFQGQGKYPFEGGRDGKAVSSLLKFDTADNLITTAKRAWAQTDPQKFWACIHRSSNIAAFASGLAAIKVELSKTDAPKKFNGCY